MAVKAVITLIACLMEIKNSTKQASATCRGGVKVRLAGKLCKCNLQGGGANFVQCKNLQGEENYMIQCNSEKICKRAGNYEYIQKYHVCNALYQY